MVEKKTKNTILLLLFGFLLLSSIMPAPQQAITAEEVEADLTEIGSTLLDTILDWAKANPNMLLLILGAIVLMFML